MDPSGRNSRVSDNDGRNQKAGKNCKLCRWEAVDSEGYLDVDDKEK